MQMFPAQNLLSAPQQQLPTEEHLHSFGMPLHFLPPEPIFTRWLAMCTFCGFRQACQSNRQHLLPGTSWNICPHVLLCAQTLVPRRCRVPRLWAILECFLQPQAGSWMGRRAAGTRTGTHMGSQCVQCKAFSHQVTAPGPCLYTSASLKCHLLEL